MGHQKQINRRSLFDWARQSHTGQRDADERIGDQNDPYMLRWFVQRKYRLLDASAAEILDGLWHIEGSRLENAYIHRFIRSDDDRALHDHPWPWVTMLLDGSYWEHLPVDPNDPTGPTKRERRSPGDIVVRREATRPHRIEIDEGHPVTTLFLTAEKTREWGFWCARGWRHWTDFVALDDLGRTRGCD